MLTKFKSLSLLVGTTVDVLYLDFACVDITNSDTARQGNVQMLNRLLFSTVIVRWFPLAIPVLRR